MKEFQGKTVEEALEEASKELGIPTSQILYSDTGKTKGLFSKKVIIEVYEFSDVVRYAEDYVFISLSIQLTIQS